MNTITEIIVPTPEKVWRALAAGERQSTDQKKETPRLNTSRKVVLNPQTLLQNGCVAYDGSLPEVDHYRLLRTLVMGKSQQGCGTTIMVTSAVAGEGKTVSAINLGLTIAKGCNHTTLLVDCDLRRQNVHKILGFESNKGLGNYFNGEDLGTLMVWPSIDKFSVISGGPPISGSSELLGSHYMKELVGEMKRRYPDRTIIFDLPPVLAGADTLTFAPLVDHIILVTRAEGTSVKDVQKALRLLPQGKVLGAVLVDTPARPKKTEKTKERHYGNEVAAIGFAVMVVLLLCAWLQNFAMATVGAPAAAALVVASRMVGERRSPRLREKENQRQARVSPLSSKISPPPAPHPGTYLTFRDLRFPGFSVGEIIVGPGGLFVVERWPLYGKIGIKGNQLFVDGGPAAKDVVDQPVMQTLCLKYLLKKELGTDVEVTPVACFNKGSVQAGGTVNGVVVVSGGTLDAFIASCKRTVPPEMVLRIAAYLQKRTMPSPVRKLCPYCNSPLVLRQFGSGPNRGRYFYGCTLCRKGWHASMPDAVR